MYEMISLADMVTKLNIYIYWSRLLILYVVVAGMFVENEVI
jgi:hypothetical protein